MCVIDLHKANVMRPNISRLLDNFATKLCEQRYASSSIKTYRNALAKFLSFFKWENLEQLSDKEIQSFILTLQEKQCVSPTYQRQILFSIWKFYLLNYNRKLELTAFYPKRKEKSLPHYLTGLEVRRLLAQCSNLKHLCILKTLYGCGLRVSEVIALKIPDIDSIGMRIMVRGSKGKKERILPLPKTLLDNLHQYNLSYCPKDHLFEGQNGGRYTAKSIQNFIKKYALKARIQKRVTPHILRHSYAIHQLEKGINIHYIKELLGHHSIKTTELYTYVTKVSNSKILSPLDYL